MLNEILQSEWFWPVVILLTSGYYGWVFLTYFKGALKRSVVGTGNQKKTSAKKLSLSWDELALGFALHKRLHDNPNAQLDPAEKALLEKTPFRELILQIPER